jgi:hypothetical protein
MSEAAKKRRIIWKHNSFFGHTAMGRIQMQSIIEASTTTPKTKEIAARVTTLLDELNTSLKERVDQ